MTNTAISRAVVLLLILCLPGCASVLAKPGFENVQHLLSGRMSQQVEWNQDSEDDAKVSQAVSLLLKEDLEIDEAVQIALLNNPTLQATYERLGIAQAELVQAGLLSNPVFDAEVHFEGSGIGTGTNLNIAQDFISLLQLPIRKHIAAASFAGTMLEVTNTVLEFAAEVKAAYLSLQALEETHVLRQTIVESLRTAVAIANRQYDAGNVTTLDIAAEKTVFARARLELSKIDAERMQAREQLNLLLGLWGPSADAWRIAPRLPAIPTVEVSSEGLETLAVQSRFDLLAAKQDIDVLGETLGLTEAYRFVPELSIGVDAEGEDGGKVTVGPNFALPIPLFDQGQARVQRVESLLRQAKRNYSALALRIRSEVRTARNNMLAAKARAEYAQSTLIPLSQQALRQTQLEYNGMLVGVFQLIAAKREEIEAGTLYVDSLRDYWLARTELEKSVGGCIHEPRNTPVPLNLNITTQSNADDSPTEQ